MDSANFVASRNRLVEVSRFKPELDQKLPAKRTRSPHKSPRFHHVFAVGIPIFAANFREETPPQTGTNPQTTRNSPQLTITHHKNRKLGFI
jgi:hypothetical protein